MIKTHHEITIGIDDKEFKISVNEMSEKQQKHLEEKFQKHTESMRSLQKLSLKVQRLKEQFELIKEENKKDALAIHKEICKVEDTMEEAMPQLKTASVELENVFTERLNMSVDGEDKEALLAYAKERGVSSKRLFDEVSHAIEAAKEKK